MKDGIAIEKFDLLFDKKSTILELDGFDLEDPSCWLKLNPKLTGFYRVHYSDDLFQNLFQNLRCRPCPFIQILSKFYPDFLETRFILISSRFCPKFC